MTLVAVAIIPARSDIDCGMIIVHNPQIMSAPGIVRIIIICKPPALQGRHPKFDSSGRYQIPVTMIII